MKRVAFIPTILLALVLTACGGATTQSSAPLPEQSAGGEVAPAAPPAPASDAAEAPALAEGGAKAGNDNTAQEQSAADLQRLVIKTADLSVTVENVTKAEATVRELANRLGGYVVKVETNGSGDYQNTRLTFRVPAERFDEALSGVQGVAKEVTARTVGGDDVTEEFVDLESRLRNLEATRDRLLTFLEKATKVSDALEVNQSLSEVQGEIEQIKGRMQYLKQSAALSTISVYLSPVPVTPIVPEEGWQPLQVARGALQALISLGQGLVNVLIVLLVWTPVWLPIVLIGRWIVRWTVRKLRRPRPTPPAPPTPAAQS